jgi:hypothetical protein
VQRVLWHESLGHFGLRGVWGKQLDGILDEVAAARPALIAAKAKQYGLDLSKESDRRMAAEEVLAEIAQNRPQIGWVQRAVAAIRRVLRGLGITTGLSNNDIIANYILPARGFVERGRSARPSSMSSPAFLRVFHGTPHTVDKFTTEKIGTGEGAQAYGWGLYFAGKREVAEHYRDKLSESKAITREEAERVFDVMLSMPDFQVDGQPEKIRGFASALWTRDRLVKAFGSGLLRSYEIPESVRRAAGVGRLYEVEIPEDGEYLLWDKPLSEQPEKVRAALGKMRIRNLSGQSMLEMDSTGEAIYRALSRSYGSDMEVSLTLREAGIRGIKFLDGVSRTKTLREVKREFLAELPEDAGFDEVVDLFGSGTFSPANETLLKALQADDWLGFDYPAQAISAALGGKLAEFDASPALVKAVAAAQDGGTYNYVIFDDADVEIRAAFSRSTGPAAKAAGWNMPETNWLDDLVYKMQDKQIDTKRVLDAIRKTGKSLADEKNVYLQEELFHGRAAKRTEDFVNRELQPLIEDMAKQGVDLAELDQFLHARHAKEANELVAARNPDLPDGGSGMKTADAQAYLTGLDPAKRAALTAAAAKVDAILAATRQTYVEYGLESQKTVDAWAGMFKHYVPLMREDHDGGMGIGQGFSIKGRESKSRTGSTSTVVDILANIAMQRERAIVRGEKNRVAQALVGLAYENPNADFWEVRSQPPTTPVYDERTKQVVNRPDPLFKSRPNVLIAKVKDSKGEVTEQAVVFNEADPRAVRMAESLKNLDATQLEGVLGVSAKITRYIASINTQFNPIFGVVNLTRDVPGAMLNLTSTPLQGKQAAVAKHVLSALRGVYADARAVRRGGQPTSAWAALWEEFQGEGGQTGYRDLFRTSADRADAIKDAIDPQRWMETGPGRFFTAGGKLKAPMGMAQRGWTAVFDWLSDYNLAMENATRLAAYKTALEQGMSKPQAASLAKNLTTNFNRKGQVGQQAGAVYAFFNAAMQGTARIGQTLFEMDNADPKTLRLSDAGKAIVGGGMLLGVMQTLLLAGAGFDDEEPPEFVRERNLVIPSGGGTYLTVPLPLGFHVLTNLGRIPTEFALGGFDKPAAHITRLLGVFADAFNPIGNAGFSMQTIAPTALDPFAALAENRDWTGKPIARESFDPTKPGHALTRDTATAPAKALAVAINWASGGSEFSAGAFSPSPDQIDYLAGQITGGVGRELSKAMQTAGATSSGEDLPPHKVPLLGRFYGDTESQSAEASRFYNAVRRIKGHQNEIKGRRENGRGEEVGGYIAEHPEARFTVAAALAEREIQKMRAQKRELTEKDAPREQVKALEDRIAARMHRFNELVASARQ